MKERIALVVATLMMVGMVLGNVEYKNEVAEEEDFSGNIGMCTWIDDTYC